MTHAESGRLGGLKNKGAANPHAKLTAEDVRAIRLLWARGARQKTIAALYGVSRSCIGRVTSGKRWAP